MRVEVGDIEVLRLMRLAVQGDLEGVGAEGQADLPVDGVGHAREIFDLRGLDDFPGGAVDEANVQWPGRFGSVPMYPVGDGDGWRDRDGEMGFLGGLHGEGELLLEYKVAVQGEDAGAGLEVFDAQLGFAVEDEFLVVAGEVGLNVTGGIVERLIVGSLDVDDQSGRPGR